MVEESSARLIVRLNVAHRISFDERNSIQFEKV